MTATPAAATPRRWHPLRWLLLAIVALGVWSVGIEPRWVAAREIDHAVAGWRGPPGLRVAVASDWHITSNGWLRVMTLERARAIVDEINASHPDVVLLPGDLIADRGFNAPAGGPPAEELIAGVLGRLRAPQGVYAVFGNHDQMRGDGFRAALERHGVRVIDNRAVRLPDAPVWVVGIGDEIAGQSRPSEALAQLPAGAQALVFMHEPSSARELPPLQGLIVAGHTHGGQVALPGLGPLVTSGKTPKDWYYGWVRANANDLYVTSGLGVSLFPIRFNRRPEWVLFRLRDALA